MKKKNSVFGLIGLVLINLLVFTTCGSGGGGGENGENPGNAHTVYIAPSPETSQNELIKITDSGILFT